MRTATIARKTNETEISVSINLDGSGAHNMATGIGFLDHMLDQLSRHSLIDMDVSCKGDLHIDFHHTAEDVGIALGQAVLKALGDKKGIRRYASADLPMDGTLTRAAAEPRGILTAALLANAAGILLFHNHPSGDPSPSAEDLAFTRRMAEAGEVVGIRVVDHIIVGEAPAFVSLRQRGAF